MLENGRNIGKKENVMYSRQEFGEMIMMTMLSLLMKRWLNRGMHGEWKNWWLMKIGMNKWMNKKSEWWNERMKEWINDEIRTRLVVFFILAWINLILCEWTKQRIYWYCMWRGSWTKMRIEKLRKKKKKSSNDDFKLPATGGLKIRKKKKLSNFVNAKNKRVVHLFRKNAKTFCVI